jgi:O-antigen/teichoic acid export membrane protein
VRLQGITVAALLFDPTAKTLMAAFGGFSSAAYYDIASRMVGLVGNALGGAQQTLVPRFAASSHRTDYRDVYNAAMDWTWLLSPVSFALLLVTAPLLSLMWAGSYQAEFVGFVAILVPAWLLSTLGTPAFYLGIGTGRLVWIAVSQVMVTGANAILGLALGASLGSTGVALAGSLSISVGTTLMVVGIHRSHALDRSAFLSVDHLADLAMALMSCALGFLAVLMTPGALPEIIRFTVGPFVSVLSAAFAIGLSRRRRRMLAEAVPALRPVR